MSSLFNRRQFFAASALSLAYYQTKGLFAEELIKTPSQTEGPFYPDKLPLDTDNDLIVINDNTTPAVGEITYLSGKILDAKGKPIRNAIVEIWQVDNNGVYLHSGSDMFENLDKNFQGFGRFTTGKTGEYLFRTVKPVPYPGRTPHIHFAVKAKGMEKFTTQCYIKGHEGNMKDGIYRSVRNDKQRESITVDFAPMEESKIGELSANFDIVLGWTPET